MSKSKSKSNTIVVPNVRINRHVVVDVTFISSDANEFIKCHTADHPPLWVMRALNEKGREIGYSAYLATGSCVTAKTPAKAFAKGVKAFWS